MSGQQLNILGVIKRFGTQILLFSTAAALGAGLVAETIGVTYQVHYSYFAALSEREETDDYSYDGFYAIQATELFTETFVGWVTAPETIAQAYEAVGVALPTTNARDLAGSVAAVKRGPLLVGVTVQGKDKVKTELLAEGLRRVVEEKVGEYQAEGIPGLEFTIKASEPWVGEVKLSRPVIFWSTFILVFFIGLNLVLLKESLKGSSE